MPQDLAIATNGQVLPILIDFNFIVNTDFGLVKYIQKNYQDDKAFNLEIVNRSDGEILSLLASRTSLNPLTVISSKDNLSHVDKLYKSFFENYKKEILEESYIDIGIDTFVQLLDRYGKSFSANPAIYVHDSLEKDMMFNRYGNKFAYLTPELSDQLKYRNPYYVKDYTFFTDLGVEDRVVGKSIYLLPVQYSIEYFVKSESLLSTMNHFTLFGKDYRDKETIAKTYEY